MRKSIFSLFSLLLIINFCFPQENGVITYSVVHDWIKQYASCEYNSKTEKERMSYVWSGNDNQQERKSELKFNTCE